MSSSKYLVVVILLLFTGCKSCDETEEVNMTIDETAFCGQSNILDNQEDGCVGNNYPDIETSPYVLPYPPGESYPTGLSNCSSSFHAAGKGDQYAFDFNMPDGTPFHAIRAGEVIFVEESRANFPDGSVGNYLYIHHGDSTFALYYHSPPDGIEVELGDMVTQGQRLGVTGTSGYAGYPHLHLIVTKDSVGFPFNGVPISFNNVVPQHTVLKSNFSGYKACEY